MIKVKFNEHDYSLSDLLSLYQKYPAFKTGKIYDYNKDKWFDIDTIYELIDDYRLNIKEDSASIGVPMDATQTYKDGVKKRSLVKLQEKFDTGDIDIEELDDLIRIKYSVADIENASKYERYIFLNLNAETPQLSDGDLGKFFKILKNTTHKANTLLKTKNIRSNPLTVTELTTILGLTKPKVYSFFKRLEKAKVVKSIMIDDKKHYSINPLYVINGAIDYNTFYHWGDTIEKMFPNLPPELLKKWAFQYINGTVSDE